MNPELERPRKAMATEAGLRTHLMLTEQWPAPLPLAETEVLVP